jgi:hypothetical protein
VAADHRIETPLRLAVSNKNKILVSKCLLGGGVQGDSAALSIAVSCNDIEVLLLLLQARVSAPWGLRDALQLPLARLLTLQPPSDEEPRSTQLVVSATSSHWAATEVSAHECLLLDEIAKGCTYSLRQLQRAMTAAAAEGLTEASASATTPAALLSLCKNYHF